MHVPDGYLGPITYGALWASMVPVWAYASKKVNESLKSSQIPHLAMASAFTLLVMLFTVPLPGGTTGHLSGSTIIAVLLGPWAAILALSVSLAIQALLFGDGGITALGANSFNIAFVGSLVGYGTWRLFAWAGKFLPPGKGDFFQAIGAGVGAYLSVNAAALVTAAELGLQPLLHGGGGHSPYFPYPFEVVLPAVMLPHLTVLGLMEGGATALVLLAVRKVHFAGLALKPLSIAFFLALFLSTAPASAHDFRMDRQGDGFAIVFGHGSGREDYDLSKVRTVRAWDAQGKEIPVTKEKKKKEVVLRPSGSPAVVVAEIDNGYWSKTIYGWKNLPKRKASRVVESNRSLNYSKALLGWEEVARKAVEGFELDIVPLKDPFSLAAGEKLPLKIVFRGEPLAGAEIIDGTHAPAATADRAGVAHVRPAKGRQLFTVTHTEPLKGDPDADVLNVTATLTFEVAK